MTCDLCAALVTEQEVTHTPELDGKLILIEYVSSNACGQFGEQLFTAGTVGKLQ